MKLAGKGVVITGGTAGIGLALAREALARGARVLVCGRDPAKLAATKEALPALTCVGADVATELGRAALLDAANGAFGDFDVLVNNAGVQTPVNFRRGIGGSTIEGEIAVNLTGPILLCAAAIPFLRERPEAAIMNVTSGLALVPKKSAPVYCATKAGLRSFTKALRWQLEGTGVRVVELLPPLVDTGMTAGRGTSKLSPEGCAKEALEKFERGATEIRAGKSKLLGAVLRVSPALAERMLKET